MRGWWIVAVAAGVVGACGTDDKDQGTVVDSDTDPGVLGDLVDVDPADDAVLEALDAGASVGLTLSATDLPAGVTVTYALTDDAGGRFAVDAGTGVITTAAVLDYETTSAFTVAARATGSDGSAVSGTFAIDVLDDLPPELVIAFPQPGNFQGTTLDAGGTAVDPEGGPVTVAVTVSTGTSAAAVDGTAWTAPGLDLDDAYDQRLTVTATDRAGESTTRVVDLSKGVWVPYPRGIAVDPVRQVAWVATNDALVIAFDLTTGARDVLSGGGVGAGTPTFSALSALTFDPVGDRLYVTDRTREAVFAVDPDTGDRAVVASNSVGSGGTFSFNLTAVAWDPVHDRLVVGEGSTLYAVDPTTGDRTVLSSSTQGTGSSFGYDALVLDPTATVAFGFEARDVSRQPHNPIVFRVDLTTGDRTEVSSRSVGSGPVAGEGVSIAYDPDGDVILLTDRFGATVQAIDPATGARTVLADATTGSGVTPTEPAVITFVDGEAFVADAVEGGVYGLDTTGDRTLYATSSIGDGPHFRGPLAAAVADDGTWAVVTDVRSWDDENRVYHYEGALYRVDLTTGARTLVTGRGVGSGPDLQTPYAVALDEAHGRAVVTDAQSAAVVAVDLSTGARTTVADASTGAGTVLVAPRGLALDGDRVFVGDGNAVLGGAVLAVDLASGDRTDVSSSGRGTGGTMVPYGLAFDATSGTLFASGYHDGDEGTFHVDVATGDRDGIDTSAAWRLPQGIARDPVSGTLWVNDTNDGSLCRVDPSAGGRVEVSNSTVGRGTRPLTWRGVAWWPGHGVLVADETHPALILVDPESGDRVTVSK